MSREKRAAEKIYNVLPGTDMGVLSAEYLEKLTEVVKKHEIPFVKITSAQRLAIACHLPEQAEAIWRDFGQQSAPVKPLGVHYLQACPGIGWCKYGRQDSLNLGRKLTEAVQGMELPAKTKVGVSGCPMNCCESFIRDLGIFGKKNGWTLVFGGNGGGLPRIGDIIGEGLNDQEVISLALRCLAFYRDNARKKERSARFMERTDLQHFKMAVAEKLPPISSLVASRNFSQAEKSGTNIQAVPIRIRST